MIDIVFGVWSYGQTGTGKTFTMEGEKSSEGGSWEKVLKDKLYNCNLFHLIENTDTKLPHQTLWWLELNIQSLVWNHTVSSRNNTNLNFHLTMLCTLFERIPLSSQNFQLLIQYNILIVTLSFLSNFYLLLLMNHDTLGS